MPDSFPMFFPCWRCLWVSFGISPGFAWALSRIPGTGEIERDLPQAKVAIDTVAFLATQLEPLVAPEERLPLKALVSDLQVNFVEQSKRAQ
jgi:hypothetical protein